MKKLTILSLASLSLGLFAFAVAGSDDQGDKTIGDLAKAKLEAAKKAYEKILENEKLVTGVLPNSHYTWSKHWLEAELDLAKTRAERVKAYSGHLDRLNAMIKNYKAELQIAGKATLPPEIEYYRLEAELWLAKAKE